MDQYDKDLEIVQKVQEEVRPAKESHANFIKDIVKSETQQIKEQIEIQEHIIIILIELLKEKEYLPEQIILQAIERIENMQVQTSDDVYFAKAALWFKLLLSPEKSHE